MKLHNFGAQTLIRLSSLTNFGIWSRLVQILDTWGLRLIRTDLNLELEFLASSKYCEGCKTLQFNVEGKIACVIGQVSQHFIELVILLYI